MEEQNEQRERILPGQDICLGRQGENLVRELRFDLSDFLESYPNGRITLVAQRNGEDLPYPVIHTRQSNRQLIWTPSNADTGKCGYGRCELRCYDGDRLAKSNVWTTFTLPALGMPGTLPDAAEDYITAMQRIGDAVNQAQKQAPKIGQNGNWWIYDAVTECYLDSGYPARGAQGPQGVQGEPGHVPLDVTLTQAGQAADAKKTGDEIGGLKSIINRRRIVNSVNGDYPILTIPDGADGGAVKILTVSIAPIQSGSGTPSAENVRPISGWTGAEVTRTGKNLFDKATVQPGYIDDVDGGQKSQSSSAYYECTDYIRVEGGMSVYIRSEQVNSMWGAWYDSEKRFISGVANYANKVITAPATAEWLRLTIRRYGSGDVDTFGVNYPATDTEYHAYQGQTYSVTFPSSAGTVYGGTLDVTNGTLTVTHGQISSYNGETLPGAWISDRDVYTAGTTPTTGAQVVYELAEPVVYQLTPEQVETLLGVNNIWADCGSVEVTYCADATIAYEHLDHETAKKSMLARVEDGMTATQNYTTGDLLIVEDTLYRVTAAIPNGGAITLGTNVTATTMAAEIAASGDGGGGSSITVDSALSSTSKNPVQNKVIKAALDAKATATSVPVSGSVSNAGVLSFANSAGTQLFSVQLPLYAGGVD